MSPHHTANLAGSQSVAEVFQVYKNTGETLAVLLERARKEKNIAKDIPMTYAGRLDPMAEGLVLLLVGEACKRKEEFLGIDKTYVFEVLFGVSTDTFDVLGLITETKEYLPTEEEILKTLEKIKNTTTFTYPPFSSKPVNGKPLFMHAKAGALPKEMPTMQGEVHSIVLQNTRMIKVEEAAKEKLEVVKKVEGDFRQKEIIKGWEKFLENNKDKKCLIATFETTVSSGIYIRTLATMFTGPALAYSIKRTKVGDFSI